MMGAFSRLDHVLVGVRDLEAARAAWVRLGFNPCPRGRHMGWGTANYCLMFPGDYIELLGIVDPTQFVNRLDSFLESGEGLLGISFASRDLAASAGHLARAGIVCEGPKDLKRTIELPGGDVFPAFKLLYPPPEAAPGLNAFACNHLTPELVWNPAWLEHPNKATAIADVVSVAADPGALAPAYALLLGSEAVRSANGALEARCGRAMLRVLTPEAFRERYPGSGEAPAGDSPRLAALSIGSSDLAETRRVLESKGVAFVEAPKPGALDVPPEAASGVRLSFLGV
jgi:hypothetical protein